jgi:hypothetical protein
MLKKILCLAVAVLTVNVLCVSPASARTKEERAARFVERVKEGVARLGTGPDARVEVKLQDKTKLKGYLSEVNAEGFVVTDSKTGVATRVAYPQVTQVKGHNLTTGQRIAVAFVLAAATLIALCCIAAAVSND